MTESTVKRNIVRGINFFDLIGIVVVLIAAFVVQFSSGELPCPLCLLQRVGLFFIAFGLLMNINGQGNSLRNYAISGLGALFMGATALRQMLLHIVPGSGAYGEPIFGLHLYTWSLIISVLFLISILFSMLFGVGVKLTQAQMENKKYLQWIKKIITLLCLTLALFSSITAFMECGFLFCPDNPVRYEYADQSSHSLLAYSGAAAHQCSSSAMRFSHTIHWSHSMRV